MKKLIAFLLFIALIFVATGSFYGNALFNLGRPLSPRFHLCKTEPVDPFDKSQEKAPEFKRTRTPVGRDNQIEWRDTHPNQAGWYFDEKQSLYWRELPKIVESPTYIFRSQFNNNCPPGG